MLPAANRLPKEEIPLLLRRGTHVRSGIIELIYRKTADVTRFAFIVSKKIDKRATARNRMRRIMSESVRHLLVKTGSLEGILIAKKNFAELPHTEVEKIVRGLLCV